MENTFPEDWPWSLTPPTDAEVIDTGAARWWLDGFRIICNQSYTRKVTPENLRAGLETCRALSPDLPIVLIADSGPLAETTHEARKLLASAEAAQVYGAMAVLVRNPVAAVVMNFFARIMRPPFTVSVFRSPDAARAWAAAQVDRMITEEAAAETTGTATKG